MTELEIFEIVKDVIARVLSEDIENITEKTRIDLENRRPFGMDSLDAVEIIVIIEDEFDVSLADEEVKLCKNIEQLVSLIARKLNIKSKTIKK